MNSTASLLRLLKVAPLALVLGLNTAEAVLEGAKVTFTASAEGTPSVSYAWKKNGVIIPGATNATLVLPKVVMADAGAYRVVASNPVGSAESANESLVVEAAPRPVVVVASVSGNGVSATPASAAVVPAVRPAAATEPVATLTERRTETSSSGTVSTAASSTTVPAANTANVPVAPSVVVSGPALPAAELRSAAGPANASPTATSAVILTPAVVAPVSGNGVSATPANAAEVPVVRPAAATEPVATATAGAVRVETVAAAATEKALGAESVRVAVMDTVSVPNAPEGSRIVNLSVRSRIAPESESLVVGFVLGGNSSKPVLVRGVGPALADFGVVDSMIDPSLMLYSGGSLKGSNDNWATSESAAEVRGTVERLGAFPLAETGTDAALVANLTSGAYTVELRNKSEEAGVALLEVYDAGTNSGANLVNMSVLARVDEASEAPSLGFVVSGNTAKRVLIRAVGPTLANFGVEGVLADPKLEIFKEGVLVGANDNWKGDAALSAAFARVGAFGLDDAASADAAMVVTLEPGAYTVVASGASNATGTALVEIYDLP